MSTAGILIIGNEILSGKVPDENLPFLLPELRRLGVSVDRVNVIPDEIAVIADEVRWFAKTYDYVITTGGVGPTHDDVTMEGVARAFSCELVMHPRMEELLRHALKGQTPNESVLKMCLLPEGADLIETPDLWFPLVRHQNVYIFPGIPSLLRKKFVGARGEFKGRRFHLRQVFVRCMESDIAQPLRELLEEFPDLMLGSYPRLSGDEYHTLLTLESHEEAYVSRAVEALLARIPPAQLIRVE
ncbi:MAG: competence/damage-inducible protein A [Myxococcota bacterium]